MIKLTIAVLVMSVVMTAGCHTTRPVQTVGQRQFEGLVRPATHLVIRTGGLCHRYPEDEAALLDTQDPEVISGWVHRFALDVDKSIVTGQVEIVEEVIDGERFRFVRRPSIVMRGLCGCCGSHTFSFMQNTNTLMTFSLHHDSHIRTSQIYRGGDIDLLPESRKEIAAELQRLERNIRTRNRTVSRPCADSGSDPVSFNVGSRN